MNFKNVLIVVILGTWGLVEIDKTYFSQPNTSKTKYELIENLEGLKLFSYKCTQGKTSIGYGFNMEQKNARQIWNDLAIPEDFNLTFQGLEKLSIKSAEILHDFMWLNSIKMAKKRALKLNVDWDSLTEVHQFLIVDIAYNTGSINGWTQVFRAKDIKEQMKESRRKQEEVNTRIDKIINHFN